MITEQVTVLNAELDRVTNIQAAFWGASLGLGIRDNHYSVLNPPDMMILLGDTLKHEQGSQIHRMLDERFCLRVSGKKIQRIPLTKIRIKSASEVPAGTPKYLRYIAQTGSNRYYFQQGDPEEFTVTIIGAFDHVHGVRDITVNQFLTGTYTNQYQQLPNPAIVKEKVETGISWNEFKPFANRLMPDFQEYNSLVGTFNYNGMLRFTIIGHIQKIWLPDQPV
jgi:hypothetical protein